MHNVIDGFKDEYEFLSNFYRCTIILDGITYGNVEEAFQASKVLGSTPEETYLKRIRFAGIGPGKAKRLGRTCELREDWDSIKDEVMLQLVRQKFYTNTDLAYKLINTGNSIIIEGNWWHDNYWGDCKCDKCISKVGKNKLGMILMQIRNELLQ